MASPVLLLTAPRSRSLRTLFIVGVALICATSLVSWIAFSRLEHLTAQVERTRQVLSALDALPSDIQETAVLDRAAANPQNPSGSRAMRDTIAAKLIEIRALTVDPTQQRRLDDAEAQIKAAMAATVPTDASIGHLRSVINEIATVETGLYQAESLAVRQQTITAKNILIGGTALSLAVMTIVFGLMRREATQREASKSELRRVIETRTAELSSTSDALKLLDEDLIRTRAFLKLVIEHVPGMLFIKDAKEFRFVLVNRGAEELLGYDRRELMGKTDAEVFPREQAERFLARDRRVLASRRAETIEDEVITTRDSGIRHLQTRAVPVLDEQGRPQFLLGFSEDITNRRGVEQQLRQAQKMEAIGQLTGGVAHDFNNLLMVILGNLELLEVALENQPALHKLVRTAMRGADRGATLVKSLLAFARKQPLEPTTVDLNKLLRETVEMLIRTLGENIEVEVEAKPELWTCEVDPGQLQSALLNLAINARDAMPSGGKLIIGTDCTELDDNAARQAEVRAGQYVVLAVSDTGTGIPPEILDRVFDPFFTTKEPGKGSGLGLSMVYGVVKQSRGHVKIWSEVGRGTTVRIYLPRVHDGADLDKAGAAPHEEMQGNETILVVEDDTDVRALTTTMLKGLGYQVVSAASTIDARSVLAQQKPDLLLTDVILTGTANGRELADEALAQWPDMKVLFMSGYAEGAVLHEGRLGTSAPLLQKPFRKQDLAAKVRAALDAAETSKE